MLGQAPGRHQRQAHGRRKWTWALHTISCNRRGAFPEMKGFSPRNLKYMKAFAEACPRPSIFAIPALTRELPLKIMCSGG
ncbi:hypothetical protein KKD52_09245, partial [Myxococcota bacterium]|nr:hypothetical protein [Myxococcota bacterium]